MRIASVWGRLTVVTPDGGIDVEEASAGQFDASPAEVYAQWDEFQSWASSVAVPEASLVVVEDESLGAASPEPKQVFAVGLNYRDHAAETGFSDGAAETSSPAVFTKFPTCVTGPFAPLVLPSGNVDWEVELVVVVGRRAERVAARRAWDYVAGVTVGQDYSERAVQMAGPVPQFSLGKSYAGFGPTGPWLVSPDELADPNDLELRCVLNGDTVQKDRTSNMIFSVEELIAYLSCICPLLPGDLIFTGTPSGVGIAREPRRLLVPGDEVVSVVEGIGSIRQICVEAPDAS